MTNHQDHANLIWQIADLLRGPYRPPQYERVMLPMTVLRRFDCVLAPTQNAVLKKYEQIKERHKDTALESLLNKVAGVRSVKPGDCLLSKWMVETSLLGFFLRKTQKMQIGCCYPIFKSSV